MPNASQIFKQGFDNAAKSISKIEPEVMLDLNKIKDDMKEDNDKLKKSAKKIFAKDLQDDPDFIEFKKNAKYKRNNTEFTYGTPNVSVEDPYIQKKKYSRVGKLENNEVTGSGSSGAYSAPLFGENDFIEKSEKETPEKIEATEATGSGSVGAYESPAAWAKTTNKEDWRGKSKTQIPGGAFVSVKKKCKSFPYCNQGDIKSLNIYKNKKIKEAIKNVAEKLNINETVVKAILEFEFEKMGKHIN